MNKLGDWDDKKASLCGLTYGQQMDPATSAAAALEWWRYKAYWHDDDGNETSYKGDWAAFRDYNGRTSRNRKHPAMEHRVWYANEVLRLDYLMSHRRNR